MERLVSEYQNKVVFARWGETKENTKVSKRIIVIGSYMIFIIKQARIKSSMLGKKKKTLFPGSVRLKVALSALFPPCCTFSMAHMRYFSPVDHQEVPSPRIALYFSL